MHANKDLKFGRRSIL